MYKFKKRSIQMAQFNKYFSDQLDAKKIGIGIAGLISMLMIIAAILLVFVNFYEGSALDLKSPKGKIYSNGKLMNIESNETCYWECDPLDMSCYTRWDDIGANQFKLKVDTPYGWAFGTADCEIHGLFEPGYHDIRGFSGGVAGDSHGNCTIVYKGYWVEDDGYGYHHWEVNNYNQRLSSYQPWKGNFKLLSYGGISVDKSSSWVYTKYLSSYSLLNCCYDVYYTFEDAQNRTNATYSIMTNANGHGESMLNFISNQKLYVRESNMPGKHGCGYHYNDDIGYVIIQPELISPVIWSDGSQITYDVPYVANASLSVIKSDNQTREPGITEGSVESFEGAHYEFYYRGAIYKDNQTSYNKVKLDFTWVMATDENGEVAISEKYRDNKVDGDDFIEWNGQVVLPLGSCLIREVKAPDGYLLSDKEYLVTTSFDETSIDGIRTEIRDINSGEYVEQIVDPHTSNKLFFDYEQVVRGDYKFIKVNDRRETLSDIPFKITSVTTGEWHICVTDNDGIIDTSTNHHAHSNLTNINDSLYNPETNVISDESQLSSNCGIWFAYDKKTEVIAPANDNLGALPYDTYLIEEIPISANEKYLPFETRTFVVDNHGYLIDGPEWVNKEPFIPIVPIHEILPQTGDVPFWIFGLPILGVLCYIMRRWVYYRKY